MASICMHSARDLRVVERMLERPTLDAVFIPAAVLWP